MIRRRSNAHILKNYNVVTWCEDIRHDTSLDRTGHAVTCRHIPSLSMTGDKIFLFKCYIVFHCQIDVGICDGGVSVLIATAIAPDDYLVDGRLRPKYLLEVSSLNVCKNLATEVAFSFIPGIAVAILYSEVVQGEVMHLQLGLVVQTTGKKNKNYSSPGSKMKIKLSMKLNTDAGNIHFKH